MPYRKINSSQGFTLTEVMIVVAILAILILMGIMAYLNNLHKANDATRKSDIANISTALEAYYSDNNCYPDPALLTSCGSNAMKPYLDTVPCDPVSKTPYCYFVNDPSKVDTCWQTYHALAALQNKSDADVIKLGCDGPGYCGWETECGATSVRFGFNYGVASRNVTVINPDIAIYPVPIPSGFPTSDVESAWSCTPEGHCDFYTTHDLAVAAGCKYFFPTSFQDSCEYYCNNLPEADRCTQ